MVCRFLKVISLLFVLMCLCVGVCTVQVLWRPEKGVGSSGAGAAGLGAALHGWGSELKSSGRVVCALNH